MELAIRTAMTRLGAGLLEDLLGLEAGYRGPRVDCGAGHQAGFVSYRDKTIDTVLGPVRLRRAWYHCAACGHGLAPQDAELGIEQGSMSPGLAKMTARAAAAVPFAKAAGLLAELAGIELTVKRVERSAEATGAAAAAAIGAQADAICSRQVVPLPPPGPAPDMLYIAVDGTGVPMTAAETEGRKGKADDGKARTREVKLACLFTQTSTDDDGRPVRDPGSSSYLATFEPAARFGQLVDAEARRRGSEHIRQLVVLGDGAAWIWNLADELFPAATQIVDLYHAREHVHDLATLAARLLRGQPDWLAAAPRRTRRRRHPRPARRRTRPEIHRLPGQRTRQGPGLLRDQRPPDALQALPLPGHVRRLRCSRGRLQSGHRPAAETLRHALDQFPAPPASPPCAARKPATAGTRSGSGPTTRRRALTSPARQADLATYKIGAHP